VPCIYDSQRICMIVKTNVIEISFFFCCYGLYQDIIPIEKRDGAEDEI
jgi:hypothetical protein